MNKINQSEILETIEKYSNMGFYIEVLADGYKIEDVGICWRGYVSWKEDGEWVSDDCGCLPNWLDSFNLTVELIEELINR